MSGERGSRGAGAPQLHPNGYTHVRGVLFDVDGTLYRQRPLRRVMAFELAAWAVRAPGAAMRGIRAIGAYRRAHEALRLTAAPGVAAAQVAAAAGHAGLPADDVGRLVREWMHERPLRHLAATKADGLDALLDLLAARGLRLGVLSDYPAAAKLDALGLGGRFSPVLCTTDPEIDALKPNPRGFLHACRTWNLAPAEVLMVGDRADADGAGAAAAGMPCVLVGRHAARGGPLPAGCTVYSSFERLRHAFS